MYQLAKKYKFETGMFILSSNSMSEVILSTKGLAYSYSSATKFQFPDINLEKGAQMLIIGPSGCGKTTMLHLLAGLRSLQDGEVLYQGKSSTSIGNMDSFRGKHIGIVFQQPHFVKSISVRKNLQLAAWCSGLQVTNDKINTLAKRLKFDHRLEHKTHKLSQGEKQRVSIARALINNPVLLLADEPTSALDDDNCTRVVELLNSVAEESGASLVIVTHDARVKSLISNQVAL
ncbi:MAG: ABC-type lipoprotein export system ATPase subunit [Limisphaerales bacterium]|jgi:ABC-type lipoprotein export system ATPase subunit